MGVPPGPEIKGGDFSLDNYAGPSNFTRYEYCGPCQTTGAERLEWLRLNPQVMDPWKFKRIDASFSTHHHGDHADSYTVKALLKTTKALFVGPKLTCMLFRKWGVPESRIKEVKPGDRIKFKSTEVVVEKNFDYMATRTTTGLSGVTGKLDYDDVAVTFIFKNSGAISPSWGTRFTTTGMPPWGRATKWMWRS